MNTDHGSQFTFFAGTDWLRRTGVRISMDRKGRFLSSRDIASQCTADRSLQLQNQESWRTGGVQGKTVVYRSNSKTRLGKSQLTAPTGYSITEITETAFNLHGWRGAERLQNDTAPFCGVDKRVQMRLRQATLRFQIDFHVRVLKPYRYTVTCYECPSDVCTKTDLHFEVAQSYLLEVGNHADRRIKATCQRSGKEFAGTRKIAFASDSLVDGYGDIQRYAFAADDMAMKRVVCRNLGVIRPCVIINPRGVRLFFIALAQWRLPVENIERLRIFEGLDVVKVFGIQCHFTAPVQVRE